MQSEALLEKHKPILVIFPQQAGDNRLWKRPGSRRPGREGWGDYNPCSAEFFLNLVEERDQPKPWVFNPLSLIPGQWKPGIPTGIEVIRQNLMGVDPLDTEEWELDVAPLPSQNEKKAWRQYQNLLSDDSNPYEPVVYGRYVSYEGKTALQYWYLYVYNDFWNNHEGDWEMATIELGTDDKPLRVGYSNHHTGIVMPWSNIAKADDKSGRPLLFVARGSHAGYFGYRQRGYYVINLDTATNAPRKMSWIAWMRQNLPLLKRFRDYVPHDPYLSNDEDCDPKHIGIRLETSLRVMPDETPDIQSEWWWMLLRCRWGSRHPRLSGYIGVPSPWASRSGDLRWNDPIGWLNNMETKQAD